LLKIRNTKCDSAVQMASTKLPAV